MVVVVVVVTAHQCCHVRVGALVFFVSKFVRIQFIQVSFRKTQTLGSLSLGEFSILLFDSYSNRIWIGNSGAEPEPNFGNSICSPNANSVQIRPKFDQNSTKIRPKFDQIQSKVRI